MKDIFIVHEKIIEKVNKGNASDQALQEQAPGHNFDNNNMKISYLLFIVAFLQKTIFITKLNHCSNCGSSFIVFRYHLIIFFDFVNYLFFCVPLVACYSILFSSFNYVLTYFWKWYDWSVNYLSNYIFCWLPCWSINNLSIICSRI